MTPFQASSEARHGVCLETFHLRSCHVYCTAWWIELSISIDPSPSKVLRVLCHCQRSAVVHVPVCILRHARHVRTLRNVGSCGVRRRRNGTRGSVFWGLWPRALPQTSFCPETGLTLAPQAPATIVSCLTVQTASRDLRSQSRREPHYTWHGPQSSCRRYNNNSSSSRYNNNNNKVARASAAARGVSFIFRWFFGRKLENPVFGVVFRQQHDVSVFSFSIVVCSCFLLTFLRNVANTMLFVLCFC